MRRQLRSHLTFVNVTATLALFLILAILAIGADSSAAFTQARSSPSFAGYSGQFGGSGCCTAAAKFKVPRLSGCGATLTGIAPSVGVYRGHAGNTFSYAEMFVGCQNGKAHYWPSLVVNGKVTNYPKAKARPGDTISLRVSQTSSKTSVSVVDETQKVKRSAKGTGSPDGNAPWVGDDGWLKNGKLLGVPNFGTLTFTHAMWEGHPVGSSAALARWNRVTPAHVVQITTGGFSGGNTVFDTVFKHS